MKLKLVSTVFLLLGTIQLSSAETPFHQSSPEALVSDLYKQKSSPFFQTKDHGLVSKYFSERLAQLKDSAEVIASFENMGHKTEITYSLVLIKMGWKISNIKYADGRNLVGLLNAK